MRLHAINFLSAGLIITSITGHHLLSSRVNAAIPVPIPESSAPQNITHMGDVESLILTITNNIRQKHGLKRLRSDTSLRNIARKHSDDMINRDFFAHKNPDGDDAGDRIAVGHRRLIGGVGENIWQYSSTLEMNGRRQPDYIRLPPRKIAEQAMDGWMNSPGHRENILRDTFTHLGVGVSIVKGKVTATQNFGSIRAYTKMAIPKRVRKGGLLNLENSAFPSSQPDAVRYDYWIEKKDKAASDILLIDDREVAVKNGVYRIRFYFPIDKGYMIYLGPRIEVR